MSFLTLGRELVLPSAPRLSGRNRHCAVRYRGCAAGGERRPGRRRRQGGRSGQRRGHPEQRVGGGARGHRRLRRRRGQRAAERRGARARHARSRDITNNTPMCSRARSRGSAANRTTAKPSYSFPVETLKTQNDVLRFAANLEKGAVSAYLGAVPLFKDRDLSKAAASILGDEAMHWAVLRQAVGEEPVPAAFVS